jgi:SAM-dependent methyltransferase
MLAMADLRPGERVLDVACGTGLVSLRMAEAVGASGEVVGTDISGQMVEAARRIAAEREVGNASFERSDAEDLPFPDRTFDVAVCGLGLMYVPDAVKALCEMRRVLRPGGRAAAAVWGARRNCGWAEIFPITDVRVGRDRPVPAIALDARLEPRIHGSGLHAIQVPDTPQRDRPAEDVEIRAVALREIENLVQQVFGRVALHRHGVANLRVAGQDSIAPDTQLAAGIEVGLDLDLDRAYRHGQARGPGGDADREAARERRAAEHAGRRRRLVAAHLGGHVGGELPRALLDLAAQAGDQAGPGGAGEVSPQRLLSEQLDVALGNLPDRHLLRHPALQQLWSTRQRPLGRNLDRVRSGCPIHRPPGHATAPSAGRKA